MRVFGLAFTLLALFAIGCAALQATAPPVPKNPTQGLILAAYETTAVVNAAGDSYSQGLISRSALDSVLVEAEKAESAIRLGKAAIGSGDPATAAGQLTLARNLLLAMRATMGGDQ